MNLAKYYEHVTGVIPQDLHGKLRRVSCPEKTEEFFQEQIESDLFRFYQDERVASAHRREDWENNPLSVYKSRA